MPQQSNFSDEQNTFRALNFLLLAFNKIPLNRYDLNCWIFEVFVTRSNLNVKIVSKKLKALKVSYSSQKLVTGCDSKSGRSYL